MKNNFKINAKIFFYFVEVLYIYYVIKNRNTMATKIRTRLSTVTNAEYMAVRKLSKEQILSGILYRIHSLSVRDNKWDLTNAYFESRLGSFEIKN